MTEEDFFQYVRRAWAEPMDCVYVSTTPNGKALTASLRYDCIRKIERANLKLEAASEVGLLKDSLKKALKSFGVEVNRPLPEALSN